MAFVMKGYVYASTVPQLMVLSEVENIPFAKQQNPFFPSSAVPLLVVLSEYSPFSLAQAAESVEWF